MIFDLARQLKAARDAKKELEDQVKEKNAEIETLENQLVAEMVSEEMQNFTLGDHQYIMTAKLHAGAKAGAMPEICTWMKENGLAEMVKESVHSQTLQAWAKETIGAEGALPEEIGSMLNVYEKAGVTVRRK